MPKVIIPSKLLIFLLIFSLLLFGSCRENSNASTDTNIDNLAISDRPEYDNRLRGQVIRIADGDSFTVLLDNNEKTKVRLFAIDAPERRQAFSNVSRKSLSSLILNKKISIYYDEKDVFGRILGVVFLGNLNINEEQVRRGLAWHFTRYSDSPKLSLLEKEARAQRKGLWQDTDPVAPWNFRRN